MKFISADTVNVKVLSEVPRRRRSARHVAKLLYIIVLTRFSLPFSSPQTFFFLHKIGKNIKKPALKLLLYIDVLLHFFFVMVESKSTKVQYIVYDNLATQRSWLAATDNSFFPTVWVRQMRSRVLGITGARQAANRCRTDPRNFVFRLL